MKLNKTLALSARKGFTLVELLVVIAIIAALAGLSYGPIMKQINAADRTEAISNGRSINTALLSFYAANDAQYPSLATSRLVPPTLTTANDAFQQLIDAGLVDDEVLFWNRTNARAASIMGTTLSLSEPDNDRTLDADECVFNYVVDLDAGDGTTPIFFDSLIAGGTNFSAETWDGKAVVAYVDGSVVAEQIQFNGPAETSPGVFASGQVTIGSINGGIDVLNPLPGVARVIER